MNIRGEKEIGKRCTKCGKEKVLGDFHRSKHGLGGRLSQCKMCKREIAKKYYDYKGKRRYVYIVDGIEYKKCNKCEEEKRVSEFYPHGKSYDASCKDCYNSSRRKNTVEVIEIEDTPEGKAKKCKACGEVRLLSEYPKEKRGLGGRRSSCTSCSKEQWKKYREENRERVNASTAVWRQRNPVKQRESQRKWRIRNRFRDNAYQHNRKARKKELRNDLTARQWEDVLKNFDYKCSLTGNSSDVTLDHFIPITYGGGTYLGNVIPMNTTLNNSKHNRNPFEWFEEFGERHGVTKEKWNEAVSYLAKQRGVSFEEYRDIVYRKYEQRNGSDTGAG